MTLSSILIFCKGDTSLAFEYIFSCSLCLKQQKTLWLQLLPGKRATWLNLLPVPESGVQGGVFMPIAVRFFRCPSVFSGSSKVYFDGGKEREYFLCCREDRLLLPAGNGAPWILVSESLGSSWGIPNREWWGHRIYQTAVGHIQTANFSPCNQGI